MTLQDQDIIDHYLLDSDAHADGSGLLVSKYTEIANRRGELIPLEMSLVRGEIQYEDVMDLAARAFGMSPDRAELFAQDFVGYFILPIAKYVPHIVDAFKRHGGTMDAYPGREASYTGDRVVSTTTSPLDIEEQAEALQEIKELPPLDPIPAPVKDAHPLPPPVLSSKPAPEPVSKSVAIKPVEIKSVAPAASAATVRTTSPIAAMTHAVAASVPVVNGEFMTAEERAEIEQHKVAATQAAKQAEESLVQVSKDAQALTEKAWPHVKIQNSPKPCLVS